MNKQTFAVLLLAALTACTSEKQLDKRLDGLIEKQHLASEFIADLSYSKEQEPLAHLGGLLFFSPDLSLDGSASCASCHHPTKAGADGLAMPVGIGGVDSTNIGMDRLKAAGQEKPDVSPERLVARNAPSTINTALYRKQLFWDGRIQYVHKRGEGRKIVLGFGAGQSNPNDYRQDNLLQTQVRMPISSAVEMKGSLSPHKSDYEIEEEILAFLRSNERWCNEFGKAFNTVDCREAITLDHFTDALSVFLASMTFVNSPFEQYIKGDKAALTKQQKQGAISFLTMKEEGGAGCAACHSGKTFSNEGFYNINIPPSGRGANDGGLDLGRFNVDKTAERFSFRVPNLLNVALTGPYFHNGVALTLEDAIRHKQTAPDVHKNSRPIQLVGIDYEALQRLINDEFERGVAKQLLPDRLSEKQISNLAAFLRSLTDPCLENAECLQSITPEIISSPRKAVVQKLHPAAAGFPPELLASARVPVVECNQSTGRKQQVINRTESMPVFTAHNTDVGINHQRTMGKIRPGWLIEVVNYSSVAAVDVDYDCLDDLLFDAGNGRLFFYRQQPDGTFKQQAIPYKPAAGAVNALIADVNGDYRFDLIMGNYGQNPAVLVSDFQNLARDIKPMHRLTGPVINATVGDLDADGYMDVVFGMWRAFNSLKQWHIWFGDGKGNWASRNAFIEQQQGVSMEANNPASDDRFIRQDHENLGAPDFTFTPNMVDITNNGEPDLLMAVDFNRSQVLLNQQGTFADVTDKKIIDDSNGMGAAIADFNGDGLMDWFVTSINDRENPMWSGHRLYLNEGGGRFRQQAIPLDDIIWSWGTCAADFNNDGYMDIFYVSGYGEPLLTAEYETEEQAVASAKYLHSLSRFSRPTPKLLINDGRGNFTDRSAEYGFTEPLPARGVSCFDYQQDGDIDVVVVPLEGTPVLYRNNLEGKQNWISLRLIGLPGNTETFGAKVTLFTAKGKQHRQVRFENNFVSRNPAQLHFGLGHLEVIEKIEIKLPQPYSRKVTLTDMQINRLHILYAKDFLAPERLSAAYESE